MHLCTLHTNGADGPRKTIDFHTSKQTIKKWTLLDATAGGYEALTLLAAACRPHLYSQLRPGANRLPGTRKQTLRLEYLFAAHCPQDIIDSDRVLASGAEIFPPGKCCVLTKDDCPSLPAQIPFRRFTSLSKGIGAYFCLAYAHDFKSYNPKDASDIQESSVKLNRIRSMFEKNAPLTNPVKFLQHLQYKCYVSE